LKQNNEGFLKLANQLLDKEVIFADDLEAIFGKRPSVETPQEETINATENSEHVN